MPARTTVVISQSPSRNPAKKQLEHDIVAGLLLENGIDVTIIPNLYDIKPDSTGMLALDGISGNMIVVSWLYERAAHWILDRNNICGHVGTVLLTSTSDDDDEDDEFEDEVDDDKDRVIESREIPNRKIYCLDLRVSNNASEFVDEIKRIHKELSVKLVQLGDLVSGNGITVAGESGNGSLPPVGNPSSEAMKRFANPTNDTALEANGNGLEKNGTPATEDVSAAEANGEANGKATLKRIENEGGRRWYPVIDFSRCTNCMECIDFCLFGVYGVDKVDTILVEQPDNCRKGCPACSRVCPENAIMFPQHKTPVIAGANEVGGSMKIDLSQLFGAPDAGKSAEEIAAQERDEQLMLAGRDTVGMSVGIPKRQEDKPCGSKDDLDELMDQLDELDI